MRTNKLFDNYTNLYSLSKTLRFELIPQGSTLRNIEKWGILSEDELRGENYKIVKKLIDEYHKQFISDALTNLKLDGLDKVFELYCSGAVEELESRMQTMRGQISDAFTTSEHYELLCKKYEDLINKEILSLVSSEEERKAVDSFKGFTTYFRGLNDHRQNLYSSEAKETSISNLIVNVNLPRFMDNLRAMDIIRREGFIDFSKLEKDMKDTLGEHSLADMFDIGKYGSFVRNEDIVIYNTVLGGFTAGGKKIQGINELINLQNQKKPGRRIPLLKSLYKQILSDRETYSLVEAQYENDQELLDDVNRLVQELDSHLGTSGSLNELMKELPECDLDKIYVTNGAPVTELAQKVTGNWAFIKSCLEKEFDELFPRKAKKKNDKYYDERAKYIKKEKSISIGRMNSLAERYSGIQYRFESRYAEADDMFTKYVSAREAAEIILNGGQDTEGTLNGDDKAIRLIKELLDSVKEVESLIKPLLGAGTESQKDAYFYGKLQLEYDAIREVDGLYNRVRNYVTRKPYSTEKIKLNFQNPTLLKGWDRNSEKAYYGVLLRKGDNYYLAIMTRGNNKVFMEVPAEEGETYEKMDYRSIPGSKNLARIFFAKKNQDLYSPSSRINEIYSKGTYKKEAPGYSKEDSVELIDFYKRCIEKTSGWETFDFKFRAADEYDNMKQFYKEFDEQSYYVQFRDVPAAYVDRMVEEGKLFLFQIYNKDFSPYSKGRPNLHTMYWRALFAPENLQNTVYELRGGAEIFYRKSSIPEERKIVHKKNKPIVKRTSEEAGTAETSLFAYDIIKDRRYTVDKFQLHVPITMNFSAASRINMNDLVLDTIRKIDEIYVIGIDRGERNLLYLSLVDSKGTIVEQRSLNLVTGQNGYSRDYHQLLDKREKERDRARESWTSIASIKELKEGYLSQVIHIILHWMIEYNAIIVLEDLNFGFKNGRKKVDKQVYQKFEKMLIDKLNYYVDKGKDPSERGGLFRAYQLTAPFESFQKLGKQSGFLFYIPAWNTSMIDPTTGFVNLFNTKYTNVEDARTFIKNFDCIRFNEQEGYFEFEFDYSKFTARAHGVVDRWTVCSYGERIITFRNQEKNSSYESKEVRPTDELRDLLQKYSINLNASDLRAAMCEMDEKAFYEEFLRIYKHIVQMRNSVTGTDIDYMVSPVRNSKGVFFDTRIGNTTWPLDADANGAYNIARKGRMLIDKIQASQEGKKVNLAISNAEWLNYAQQNTLE